MKAIAYPQHGLPIDDARALIELELPLPTPGPRDLRVRIHAVSVNPVDTKVRSNAAVDARACWAGTPAAWSMRSARRSACSAPAMRCTTPAR